MNRKLTGGVAALALAVTLAACGKNEEFEQWKDDCRARGGEVVTDTDALRPVPAAATATTRPKTPAKAPATTKPTKKPKKAKKAEHEIECHVDGVEVSEWGE